MLKYRSISITFGVFSLVIIVGFVVGAYYLGTQRNKTSLTENIKPSTLPQNEDSKLPSNTTVPSETASPKIITNATLLSTNNWQTITAKNFSIKVPPDLVPSVVSSYLIIIRQQKEYIAEKPQFGVSQVGISETGYQQNLYTGGSRRQWYLDYRCKPYPDEPCPYAFKEKLFENINGLEVYQPLKRPGETQTSNTRIAVLVAAGNKLFIFNASPEYSQIIDASISTIKIN